MNKLNLVQNRQVLASDKPAVLVSVLSGKGGVGKSLIAFNLAERMAFSGYRILVVDADFRCGNIHILANLNCDFGLLQYATGVLTLAEAVTKKHSNFDILPALWNEANMKQKDITGLARWFKKLRDDSTAYDFVIIDHGSGISDEITVMAHSCDINLLVLVPELTSIADCYGLYKYLVETNNNIDCRLLLNRVSSNEEVRYIQSKFFALTERFLGKVPGLLGSLPESDDFRKAVAAQSPVSSLGTNSLALQALNKVSQSLIGYFLSSSARGSSSDQLIINKNLVTADI